MAPAASLGAAAAQALLDAETKFFAGSSMATLLNNWTTAMAAAGVEDSLNGRTVLNWIPLGRLLAVGVTTGAEGLLSANDTGVYVYRTCRAAQFALASGRITAGQAAALLASYNTIWT